MVVKVDQAKPYDRAYGVIFKDFGEVEVAQGMESYYQRYFPKEEAVEVFLGARCLDGGSGAGRGSLYMATHGAASVDAVDISPLNVGSTAKMLMSLGYQSLTAHEASLTDLPFEDETFDVVWSYGVIHHTDNPPKALSELARVCKVGGRLIFFLYGRGDIQFFCHQVLRQYVSQIDSVFARETLEAAGVDINDIASVLDNWYSPFIYTYSKPEVDAAFRDLGFGEVVYPKGGMIWDSNIRMIKHPTDAQLFGAGDLRGYAIKTGPTPPSIPAFDGFNIAAETGFEPYCDVIRESYLPGLRAKMEQATNDRERVLAAYRVHRAFYDQMKADSPLEPEKVFL